MTIFSRSGFAAAMLLCAFTTGATSQPGDLEKLQRLQTGDVSRKAQKVAQHGKVADNIRKMLTRIKLPAGFKIGLYAVVPDARHMAISANGSMVFVGTYRRSVWLVTDRDRRGIADEVRAFAPSVRFDIPNGVCLAKDGTLYTAELNRVLAFPAGQPDAPDGAAYVVVKQGDLIPRAEESSGHAARVCRIGPDDKLYIAIGQPHNVAPASKLSLYDKVGIGGIVRMDRDGKNREVFARGIRNSVGMSFNPANGELWFTDNQVDRLGDTIPPEELNRAAKPGLHFGFPWYGGGSVRTKEYKDSEPPAGTILPVVEYDAHAANLGMTFYTGTMFPEKYRGGVFIAEHGSWNRTKPIGARVMFTAIKADDTPGETSIFAQGWLNEETGDYDGRPVDVAQLPDGSLLVSDDFAGALYRIWYEP